MKFMTRLLLLALLLETLTGCASRHAELPRLRLENSRIVDSASKPVFLKGVNLGNWIMIEAGGLGGSMGKFSDQHGMFTILRDRFGEAERWRLLNIYRDSFITARDFDTVKKFGFNLVRIGFDYELFEDDAKPMELKPGAFKYLDFAVREAKARGIYVLFDLHGAQERQVDGRQGGRAGYTRFWIDPKAQERSLWLWTEIFKHFKGEPTVMGYEPLNEPFSGTGPQLRDYCGRWYKALRAVDAEPIAVMPGLGTTIDFYGKPADNGWANTIFDMHFYPGSFFKVSATQPVAPDKNTPFIQFALPRWANRMKKLEVPLLIGEMNVVYNEAGGAEMVRRYYDFAAKQGWPIIYWTLKELTPAGGKRPRMWSLTTNRDPIPPVDIHTSSLAEIEAAFHSLATMPLETDPDLLHWLTTQDQPSPLKASTRPSTAPIPTGAQPQ